MNWFIKVEDGFDWREIDGDLNEALKGYADAGFYKFLVRVDKLVVQVTFRGKPMNLEGYWITCAPMRCEFPCIMPNLEHHLRELSREYNEYVDSDETYVHDAR